MLGTLYGIVPQYVLRTTMCGYLTLWGMPSKEMFSIIDKNKLKIKRAFSSIYSLKDGSEGVVEYKLSNHYNWKLRRMNVTLYLRILL